jgi:hypothetical protein
LQEDDEMMQAHHTVPQIVPFHSMFFCKLVF